MYVLFTGDDVGGVFTRKFYLTIDTSLDLTNCVVQFTIGGVVKTLPSVRAGERAEIVFSRVETQSFGVGMRVAKLAIFDPQGRYRTIANDILVKCTDVVSEVYDGENNALSYSLNYGVSWDMIDDKPENLATTEDIQAAKQSIVEALDGLEVSNTATQREVRTALQSLLERLRGIVSCAAALASLCAFGIDSTTEWQDVPPTNTVKGVVELFSPLADFSTNNTQLVETIEATSPTADFTTNNVQLVETIETTAPAPGNYATVSNRAMTALQSFTEVDPTVPAWAKSQTQPLPPDYNAVSNKAYGALQRSGGLVEYLQINQPLAISKSGGTTLYASDGVRLSQDVKVTFPNENGQLALESQTPNNITRTATDATLVHCDSDNCTNALVYIRQATSSLAGLMTAADKLKLDGVNDYANVSNKAYSAYNSVSSILAGETTVPSATSATSATSADNANYAITASSANHATYLWKESTEEGFTYSTLETALGNKLDRSGGSLLGPLQTKSIYVAHDEGLTLGWNSYIGFNGETNAFDVLKVFGINGEGGIGLYSFPKGTGTVALVENVVTTETDPTISEWAKSSTKPSYSWSEITSKPSFKTVATSGSYNDLSNKPTIPTVPTEQINAATATNALQDASISDLETSVANVEDANTATRAIVTTWEDFLDGSNVVFSITNYISGTYTLDTAKLKIMELVNGQYQEVYNSRDEVLLHVGAATNALMSSVASTLSGKADKAWGQYTSAGGEAPSDTVYMTAPNTVFAGGMEYERVAVGEGAVCVLTTKGAPVWTQGDEGTFKFQDDGGTNYFGFAKTDSYTIGANTDGISVDNHNHLVTLTYNVTMSGVPCIWYKSSLTSNAEWEQLNLPDGSAVSGASHAVTWDNSPPAGSEVCYINCGNAPSGFFKATIEVAGDAKFMTNMRADLSGGIVCPNTQTGTSGVIRPSYNGSTVIWTWSAN